MARSGAKTKSASAVFVDSVSAELDKAGDRALMKTREEKRDYAQKLSTALAIKVANGLRPSFPGIYPKEDGTKLETRAATAKGVKRLDVNYSTPELGLALGVSIKTLNFPDPGSKRYTKNVTRIDNELRAEAHDYHQRQPYAVMVALVFLPFAACQDGSARSPSSFGHAVKTFFYRARREAVDEDFSLFEKIFVALYQTDGADRGKSTFFDVDVPPPRTGPPADRLTLSQALAKAKERFESRNETKFRWATGEVSTGEDADEDDDSTVEEGS
jgi:hypothetical protein